MKEGEKQEHNPFYTTTLSKSNGIPALFYIILVCWGIINITQGIFTEISYDEAYYWVYSKHLDWGYFDQPPMIALFIKCGNLFLSQEIGTRIMTILAQLVVLLVLWRLIDEKSPTHRRIFLFFGIVASVILFEAFGFIATPDSPLLLFTTIFLFAYKRFLIQENKGHTLLLGLSIAGMAYSKYHGLLFVMLIILSNITLLKSKQFWMAGLFAFLLFFPHLFWQYQHHFPSFIYHLVSRSRPFNIDHVLNYWPNQFLSFNPFFLGLVLYLLFKFKPADTFERGNYFVIIGFLLFFFISAGRGNVEPQWTVSACICMIPIVYKKSLEHLAIMKYVQRVLFPSLLLILFLRIALVVPILPINTKFFGEKSWCEKLLSIAGDKPVVFRNTYQKPSIYAFYTGRLATSLNSIDYRKNQYDLWNFEESLYGKEVILVTQVNDPYSIPYIFPNGKNVYIHPAKNFFAANQLEINIRTTIPGSMHVGDTISLTAELINPYPYTVNFNDAVFPIRFQSLLFKRGNDRTLEPIIMTPNLSGIPAYEKIPITIQFIVPDVCPDYYKLGFVMQMGILQETLISSMQKVTVY